MAWNDDEEARQKGIYVAMTPQNRETERLLIHWKAVLNKHVK
jgi:hypothetical protein